MKFKNGIKEKQIIIRCGADKYIPFALVFGIYVILFGTVSPGGGFQGGVIVSSAVLLLYLAYGYKNLLKFINPEILRVNEAVGATIYVLLGLGGIVAGANFCRNFIFNNGSVGDMISAGTITFMSYSVGYKVLTGVSFLLILMLGMLVPDDDEKAAPAEELKAEAAEAAAVCEQTVSAAAEKEGE